MKRPSIYATAVAGFTLQASPAAYARRILDAGPEADLQALVGDMNAAYVRLKADVQGAEQTGQAFEQSEAATRPANGQFATPRRGDSTD